MRSKWKDNGNWKTCGSEDLTTNLQQFMTAEHRSKCCSFKWVVILGQNFVLACSLNIVNLIDSVGQCEVTSLIDG